MKIFDILGLASQWHTFYVGIKRDPSDMSVWRRASYHQVFPIASEDWDAGFPKNSIPLNKLAIIFNPKNCSAARFV